MNKCQTCDHRANVASSARLIGSKYAFEDLLKMHGESIGITVGFCSVSVCERPTCEPPSD